MVFIENYYSEEQIKTFLYILESILRSDDEGIAVINNKKMWIKIEVEDVSKHDYDGKGEI